MILIPPAKNNGTLTSDGTAINRVAIIGDRAAPSDRATLVIPEAAERSSGDTTAIV